MYVPIAGVAGLDTTKHGRRPIITPADEFQHAEVIFSNPRFVGRLGELALEEMIGILHFAERKAGKVTVATRVTAWLWSLALLSSWSLALLRWNRLPISKPMRLARLFVPCLNEERREIRAF